MKLLYICDRFPVLSETFVIREMAGLERRGHEIAVVSLGEPDAIARSHPSFAASGLAPVVEYPQKPILDLDHLVRADDELGLFDIKHILEIGTAHPDRLWPLLQTVKAIDRHRPALVYCHFGGVALRSCGYRALRETPLIAYFHGYDYATARHRGIDYGPLFAAADQLLTNTRYSRDRVVELGCSPARIDVLGLGIDPALFPFRERVAGGPLKLVSVARLVEKKGLADAVAAIGICRDTGLDVQYDIVGDGPLREELERQIGCLGLGERIRLLGAKDEAGVRAALDAADALMMPSVTAQNGDTEGLGVVLLEAQLCGLPVIATEHNGFPEAIDVGRSGWLVPERDPIALSAAISRIAVDASAWPEMGRRGRAFVIDRFGEKQILDRLEAVLARTAR